jgi:putative ABC transport system permease protein
MIKVALKGLAGRKVRALLTALAVVIGVSMVSGTFVLTDTMQKAFDGIFQESYEGTDAVISGGAVPASLLEKVKGLPSVETAAGSIQDLQENTNPATLLDKDGEMIGRQGESMGIGVGDDGRQFTPLKLKQGGWAHGAKQVVLDAGTARKYDFAVGDKIKIAGNGPAQDYTVQGVATFGSIDNLGGTSLAIFDVGTAQALFDKAGQFDSVSVKAKDGSSPEAVTKDIKPLLAKGLVVQTGDAQAKADAKDTNESLKFITYFLLGFGGIALFVGAFVILNTLSITVAQRSREFATLRTLGASRRQVMRSVIIEGLIVGLVASVLGLVLGLGIAQAMTSIFAAMGVELPKSGTVFATRTVIVSMLTGTIVTLVASIVPARRATRVAPISAVREGSDATTAAGPERGPRRGIIVTGLALASIAAGLFGGVMLGLTLVVGVLGLFVGIAMLAPYLVKPLAAAVGFPAERLGGSAGRLARENSVRNPGRTASTAAALMIGLALVTVVATLGAGLRGSTEKAVSKQVHADYVVTAKDGGGSFPATSDKALAGAASTASAVRWDMDESVTGIDPKTIDRFYKFDWQSGSLAGMDDRSAIVSKKYAEDNDLKVGSTVKVKTLKLRVIGVHEMPTMDPLLNNVAITQTAFDRAFQRPQNAFTFIDGSSKTALAEATAGYPDAKVTTQAEFETSRADGLGTILKMLYVLLGFSVIVSLFGMVNTLVLAVYERTRELGMLRAVGMTRRQARRMIRHESVITALIGAAMGIPLGVFLAALMTQALSKYGVSLQLPVTELIAFTVVAIVAGILAAIIPARRASRLNVLNALQYE